MYGNKVSSVRGKVGEDAVCGYLEDKGCRIIGRNFRRKVGEIDIIALKDDCLIFTEVKTRKFAALEDGAEAMTRAKMRRIISTAEMFIGLNHKYKDYYRRFDTAYVTVTAEKIPQVLEIEYFEGDFTAGDCF